MSDPNPPAASALTPAQQRGYQRRFVAWWLLVLTVLALFFGNLKANLDTETDILALLPSAEHDPVVDAALRAFSERAGRKVLFLVGAKDAAQARVAAAGFATALRYADGFAEVQFEVKNRIAETLKAYLPYREALLSPRDRQRLQDGEVDAIYREAQRALYTPAGFMRPLPPLQDPLGLLGNFLLAQVPPLGSMQIADGVIALSGEGKHWVLVVAETRDGPFANATQAKVMPVIEAATRQAQQQGAEVLSSGLLPHAAEAASKAHREVALFGSISLLGTILLLLFVHRSMRPVMMSSASIIVGLMAALVVSHWVFGRVHLLTLVFGSSLIGVAADYSTYFLTDAFRVPRRWDGRDALRQVAPGVLLGLATALTAYAALMATPFPALRQIAVFSATGLIVACGCVLCLFPLLNPPQAPPVAPWLERRLLALLPGPLDRRGLLTLALIGLIAAVGLPRLQVINDLHLMQSSSPALLDGERRVRALLNNPTDSQFLLISGDSEQQTLQREEDLRPQLDALKQQGVISAYSSLTLALPSLRNQALDAALLAKVYAPGGAFASMLRELGLPETTIETQRRAALAGTSARLQPRDWLAGAASAPYRHLWLGHVGGRYATVVTLGGIRDLAALRSLNQPAAGVRLVDKVGDISALLARFQRLTVWILLAGYAGVLLLFSLRYGVVGALRVVASPALASLATFGIFGLIGEAANLFSTFALLLVLGIGIDYAIFLREGRRSPLSSLIAVLVCAATALLSFGMLAFSSTPFIHSFGLTMLLGITLAVVIAQVLGLASDSSSSTAGRSRHD